MVTTASKKATEATRRVFALCHARAIGQSPGNYVACQGRQSDAFRSEYNGTPISKTLASLTGMRPLTEIAHLNTDPLPVHPSSFNQITLLEDEHS